MWFSIRIQASLLFILPRAGGTAHNLPNPSLITGLAKTADMICISSKVVCGGDDFRCLGEMKTRISLVKGMILRAKKGRYDPDRLNFQQVDKFLVIAVSIYFQIRKVK